MLFYCFCEKSFCYNVKCGEKTQPNRDKKIRRRQKRVQHSKRRKSFVRLLNWNHMKNESTNSIQFIVFTHYFWVCGCVRNEETVRAQESILCSSLRLCVCVLCGQRWRTHESVDAFCPSLSFAHSAHFFHSLRANTWFFVHFTLQQCCSDCCFLFASNGRIYRKTRFYGSFHILWPISVKCLCSRCRIYFISFHSISQYVRAIFFFLAAHSFSSYFCQF